VRLAEVVSSSRWELTIALGRAALVGEQMGGLSVAEVVVDNVVHAARVHSE
jgi:hypothetical protein